MNRAVRVAPKGTWPVERAVDCVTLDYEDRHRRRIRLACDGGLDVLLDLARATRLRAGDGLQLEDGGVVEVRAAAEATLDAIADEPGALARLAWHIGNRHCPAQIMADRIRIRDDHVLAEMLAGLGARVERGWAPFDPEPGAYDRHGHD